MKKKVALVHDDLVQWGGAERILVGLTELFPDAPVFTSVFNTDNELLYQNFKDKEVITSFIQKIPGWKKLYKSLLPLYSLAFESFDFSDYDIVISQTTRFAKSIITGPSTKHICYCHTPPRFLWNYSGVKVKGLLSNYMSYLRIFDRITANRVDMWVAGSENARKRIKSVYGAESIVVYPYVDQDRFQGITSFDGGYLLVISRLTGYKRVDLAIESAAKLGIPLKIVGTGPALGYLSKLSSSLANAKVDFIGNVDEAKLIQLISGCTALVVTAEEDFGLTPLEAQALGKPVIAYREGGASETIIEGVTGIFFNQQTPADLVKAISALDKSNLNSSKCVDNVSKFTKERFSESFKKLIDTI